MVGEVLGGRYTLEERVGTGGMSTVYRAHDRLLDRKVALKVLHQQYAGDVEYDERFRREARAAAALQHPNIVTVIDRGEHEGRPFIVFEYVAGENLKRFIERRSPVPVETALKLGHQIGDALAFAHEAGLVHRDVKPQNILLNGDGRAKVTDFGIARSLDVQHGMTQTGTVLGTSDYISPEQAQGLRVSEQSDVYSLGVVLYELLTNEVPFSGENFVAVAMQHINEPPPSVRARRPDVSPRLDAAVRRAMAKTPAERFASMHELCDELSACLEELRAGDTLELAGAAVRVPQRRRRVGRRGLSPWPVVATLAALGAIAAVLAVAVLRSGGGEPSTASLGSGAGNARLSATTAFDPFGSPPGEENNANAPKATDGDPVTGWSTERYYSSFAALGKPGVGLVLRNDNGGTLRALTVTTSTPGFVAEVKAGSSPTSFPTVVSASQTVSSGTRFAVTGRSQPYYLLWITQLPPSPNYVTIEELRPG